MLKQFPYIIPIVLGQDILSQGERIGFSKIPSWVRMFFQRQWKLTNPQYKTIKCNT